MGGNRPPSELHRSLAMPPVGNGVGVAPTADANSNANQNTDTQKDREYSSVTLDYRRALTFSFRETGRRYTSLSLTLFGRVY